MVFIGSFYDITIYYIYETFKNNVFIPTFSIGNNTKKYLKLLNKISLKKNDSSTTQCVKFSDDFIQKYKKELEFLNNIGLIYISSEKYIVI